MYTFTFSIANNNYSQTFIKNEVKYKGIFTKTYFRLKTKSNYQVFLNVFLKKSFNLKQAINSLGKCTSMDIYVGLTP